MTNRMKLQQKLLKLRKEHRETGLQIGELALMDDRSEEDNTKLHQFQADLHKLNGEINTLENAISEMPEEIELQQSNETTEFEALMNRVSFHDAVQLFADNRQTDGALAEMQKEFKLDSNELPIEYMTRGLYKEEQHEGKEFELAAGVTPGLAAGKIPIRSRETLLPVFPEGDAAFLRVAQPVIGAGAQAVWPRLTTKVDFGTRAVTADTAVADTALAFAGTTLSPIAIQGEVTWRRGEALQQPGLETAVRAALVRGMSAEYDKLVVGAIHDGLSGIDAGATSTFARAQSLLAYNQVDGVYARSVADLRMLMGTRTYAYISSTRDSNNINSVEQILRSIGVGMRVSTNAPAFGSKEQETIVKLGSHTGAWAPIWRNVSFVRDDITGVGKGQISLTAFMYYNAQVVDASAYKLPGLKLVS